MSFLKNFILKFYANYLFKYYYIFYQKFSWKIKGNLIKPYMELVKLIYRHFNPSKNIFHSIQIQSQTSCNLNCQFCPNNKIERQHGKMSLELYNKIIDQLSSLKFSGEILLYLQSEPLLEKRIPMLIKIASQKCPDAKISILSNGTQLNNELLCKCFESGLTFLRINDYTMVQTNNHQEIESYNIKSRITNIDCYSKYQDRIKIFTYFPYIKKMSNRSGLMEGVGIPTPLKLFCNRPFEQMYINFKGEALFCCNDWQFEEVMGDLNFNSIMEIWNNHKYNEFRKILLNNTRKGICKECDYTSVLFPKVIISKFIQKWFSSKTLQKNNN